MELALKIAVVILPLLYLALVSCAVFLLGFVLFARSDRTFAKYV